MRVLYTVLLYLAGPGLWLGLWIKGRRDPAYRRRIPERFGHVPAVPEGVAVWVHAVSVGEALAAAPLIRALIERHGPGEVYVTSGTPTGSARVQALFGDRVRHSYAPYDLPHAVARFVDRVRPRVAVVMETELWPSLFRCLARRGVPLLIANARLSPRSVRGYGRVRGFAASVLADVSLVAAQSAADAERFRQLGAPRVEVLGNLKFDIEPDPAQVAQGQALREQLGRERYCWVAASTHEGEDEQVLAAHRELLAVTPEALLVLVPRHPQRFEAVARLVEREGFSLVRRSDPGPPATATVLLGDSMGEMWAYLALADVAFVGGSLVPVGGHNVLEPAALGLPVLFGPQMHNFIAARDVLLAAGAAREVADSSALVARLLALQADPAARQRLGALAQAALADNRGALARTVGRILDHERGTGR